MNISPRTLKSFISYSIISGFFTLLSFIWFAAVYHFINPEIEIFVRFLNRDNITGWVHFNLLNRDFFLLTSFFIFASLALSALGLMSGILAKHFYGKASETLKEIDTQ